MPAFTLHVGPNIRRSPYYEATVADGVASFSVYNHMLIPGSFGDPQAEYARLIDGVVMWDVAAQRQVEIAGPDDVICIAGSFFLAAEIRPMLRERTSLPLNQPTS